MHEIHRPDLVDGGGGTQGFWPFAYQASARFDTQIELQLAGRYDRRVCGSI